MGERSFPREHGRERGAITDDCVPMQASVSIAERKPTARDETQSPAPMPNSPLLSRVSKRFRTANYVRGLASQTT